MAKEILLTAQGLKERFENNKSQKAELIQDIYTEIHRLLEVATDYGFDDNLWHNYLTFLLMTNENSFTLTSEKVGANEGSVNHFAKNDFKIFKELFDYNFYEIERELDIDCFSTISNYQAIVKKERMYNYNVSAKVQDLSARLEECKDEALIEFIKAQTVDIDSKYETEIETEGGVLEGEGEDD